MTHAHELLGVAPGAGPEELKKAYRQMVKKWHPDRYAHDTRLQKEAQERFHEINLAFEELTRKAPRKRLAAAPKPAPAHGYVHVPFMPEGSASSGGPWPVFIVLLLVLSPFVYLGVQSLISRDAADPQLYSLGADILTEGGLHRYSLNGPSGTEVYIIEGPRIPQEWEIDALVKAYTAHSPRAKQKIGNFTISQSMKAGGETPMPLDYKAARS